MHVQTVKSDPASIGASLSVRVSTANLYLVFAADNFYDCENPLPSRMYPVGIKQGALSAAYPGAPP
jgi:hypothetical protein